MVVANDRPVRSLLKAYDADCEVCFKAFDQCQLGARDAAEDDACQVALDACVRGGMIDRDDEGDDDKDDDDAGDEGANNGTNNGGNDDKDGGGDDGANNGANNGEDNDDDAGADDDDDDGDAGVDDDDGDAGVDEDDDDDGEADDPAGGDPDKKALLEAVRACVSDARDCTDAAGADVRACLSKLRACVKEVLASSFEGVCTGQRAACERNDASREARRSVEQLCEGGLR
jgi:hypothetical protein